MKKIRLYYDKDTEQDWLQEMANHGWALKNFCLCTYTFEKCEPGEYIYQIDIVDNMSTDQENFNEFMEEMGIEVVSKWNQWVYFRRKAAEGTFEMYTDVDSKIEQYKRIKKLFITLLGVEILCLLMEINAAVQVDTWIFWAFSVVIGLVMLACLRMVWKCKWKIEQLQRDR